MEPRSITIVLASIPPDKEEEFKKNVAEFTAAWPASERFVIRAVQVYP